MGKRKKNKYVDMVTENLEADVAQGVGVMVTGRLFVAGATAAGPAGAATLGRLAANVGAGQQLGSIGSIVRGSRLPLEAVKELGTSVKMPSKRRRRKKKR